MFLREFVLDPGDPATRQVVASRSPFNSLAPALSTRGATSENEDPRLLRGPEARVPWRG